jgi:hypothetical protein
MSSTLKENRFMKTKFLALTLATAASFLAWGDAIPYPTPGTPVPATTVTAATTGTVDGYFYGFSAADTDEVQVCDVTVGPGDCSSFALDNQTSIPGVSMFSFGLVTEGDVLVFNLENLSTGTLLSSDPSLSADGINHAYLTPYTATGPTAIAGIPTGTFIGMEDLSLSQGTDLDYNDDQFVFTNLSTNTVPEPSFVLLCLGLVGLLPAAREKFGR